MNTAKELGIMEPSLSTGKGGDCHADDGVVVGTILMMYRQICQAGRALTAPRHAKPAPHAPGKS